MPRDPRAASPIAHPYRDAAVRLDNEMRAVTYGRALLATRSFLVAWSIARIVVDVSCRRIDGEGLAAVLLCVTLLPAIIRDFSSR
ncbi:MAG: hypothetical protein ABI183_24070 [Polyangiaceae bacterium]